MRTPPRMLLLGLGKLLAVVVVAGLAGAGIGIGLAKLSGSDESGAAALPATTSTFLFPPPTTPTPRAQTQTQTPPPPTATTATTQTEPARTSTTDGAQTQTPKKAPFRVPRIRVVSAQLGTPSPATGGARVSMRVRVTNRGGGPLLGKTPVLISRRDEIPLDAGSRQAAGALLESIAAGEDATGVLRFTLSSAIAQRLAADPGVRLRIANRTIALKLRTSAPPAP